MANEFEELNVALQNLPDNPETRRKALLLKRYLIADDDAKTRIADIESGIFSDMFSIEEASLGERLFNLIKDEFNIESTKDLMDLHLMIMNYLKTRRIMKIQVNDLKLKNIVASLAKKWQDKDSRRRSAHCIFVQLSKGSRNCQYFEGMDKEWRISAH